MVWNHPIKAIHAHRRVCNLATGMFTAGVYHVKEWAETQATYFSGTIKVGLA